jgi:uncharacterized protein (TIGR00369 family)
MPAMTAEALEAFIAEHFPQIEHMKIRVDAVGERSIRLRMPAEYQHLRPGGTVSGPTLMALADCAIWLAVLAEIGPVALAVTTSLNINFLRKPEPGELIAEARLLKLGRRLAVGEVGIYASNAPDPVAHATVTYSIPPERE